MNARQECALTACISTSTCVFFSSLIHCNATLFSRPLSRPGLLTPCNSHAQGGHLRMARRQPVHLCDAPLTAAPRREAVAVPPLPPTPPSQPTWPSTTTPRASRASRAAGGTGGASDRLVGCTAAARAPVLPTRRCTPSKAPGPGSPAAGWEAGPGPGTLRRSVRRAPESVSGKLQVGFLAVQMLTRHTCSDAVHRRQIRCSPGLARRRLSGSCAAWCATAAAWWRMAAAVVPCMNCGEGWDGYEGKGEGGERRPALADRPAAGCSCLAGRLLSAGSADASTWLPAPAANTAHQWPAASQMA